jgi:hypothetical protein
MTVRGRWILWNNWLVRHLCRPVEAAHLLVLLPRCLQQAGCSVDVVADLDSCRRCGRCDLAELSRLRAETGVRMIVAGGGRAALALVRQPEVRAVVACACEKELWLGMRAAFPKPVLAIRNETPEGLCRNTRVSTAILAAAIRSRIRARV